MTARYQLTPALDPPKPTFASFQGFPTFSSHRPHPRTEPSRNIAELADRPLRPQRHRRNVYVSRSPRFQSIDSPRRREQGGSQPVEPEIGSPDMSSVTLFSPTKRDLDVICQEQKVWRSSPRRRNVAQRKAELLRCGWPIAALGRIPRRLLHCNLWGDGLIVGLVPWGNSRRFVAPQERIGYGLAYKCVLPWSTTR